MKVLGITGGVGSGKSEVLKLLEKKYNATVCQLDEVAKELQRSGTACFQKIVELFGPEILDENKELDRARLSAIVFQDAGKLRELNNIVHPEVKKWVLHDMEEKRDNKTALYVIEAALLVEAGYGEICDEMWYIYADERVRKERLKKSRGYSNEKITRIIGAQSSDEVFRTACTVVIDNSKDFKNTERQIGERL